MIVVDTSALISIALAEPEDERCMRSLYDADRVLIAAATMIETLIVAFGRDCEAPIRAIFDRFGLIVEPLTEARARAAADGYRRYGKGWHPAALSFGDSFAYALAIEHACPLLFVGQDFAKPTSSPPEHFAVLHVAPAAYPGRCPSRSPLPPAPSPTRLRLPKTIRSPSPLRRPTVRGMTAGRPIANAGS